MGEGSGKICLDTDIIIDYLKETKETENLMKKLYNKFDEIVLTTVTIYELLVGVEYLGGKDRDDVETVIRNCSILLLDEIVSREAAKITAELKKSGQQILFYIVTLMWREI